jgi:uncharacterized membrane protein YhfC
LAIKILFRVLNIGGMVGFPFLVWWWVSCRGKGKVQPALIGAAGFILSQIGHIPFNQFLLVPWLNSLGLPASQEITGLALFAFFVGLSAGVFEEGVRWLVFRFWLREGRDPYQAVLYGIGHGGVEAFLVAGIALLALVQVLVLGGEGGMDLLSGADQSLVREQITAYWAVPAGRSLLGAWERISAVLFQIGASLFVYRAVRLRQPVWALVAVAGHTVLDGFAVFAVQRLDLITLEVVVFLAAAAWLAWAWVARVEIERSAPDQPQPIPQKDLPVVGHVTREQLEDSRYDV